MKRGLYVSPTEFRSFAAVDKTRSLSQEIATRQRSIDFYSIGMYLPNPDPVLKKMGKDISIYKELRSDPIVHGCITSRKAGVKKLSWEIDRGKAKSRQAKYLTDAVTALPVDRIITQMLNAPLYGYQVLEVMWDEMTWTPADVVAKPQQWFVFDENNMLRFRTKKDMFLGEELPEKKFIVVTHDAEYENPYGFPILSTCFWPVTFRKGGYKFWITFTEKFGMPFIVGKQPRGTNQEETEKFADMLEQMVQDAIAVIPDDASVEIPETKNTGSADLYDKLITACKGEISVALLGHSGGAISTPGKLGGEDQAVGVRQDIVDGDKKIPEEGFNTLISWIAEYNFSERVELPKFCLYAEEDVDLDQATRDETLSRAGVTLSATYYQREYGFEEGDIVSVSARPSSSLGGLPGLPQQFAAHDARYTMHDARCGCGCEHRHDHHEFAAGEADWVAEYMQRLRPALSGAKESALQEIEAWLAAQESAPSQAEFTAKIQELLGKAYEKLDPQAVQDAVSDIYRYYKTSLPIGELDVVFGGIDQRAVDFFSNVDRMFYSRFVKNPDAANAITEFLNERYLKGGEGLFGRGDPAAIEELTNLLGQKMTEISEFSVQRIIDTSVSRVRNWANLSALSDAAITEIEIYEPTEECAFCQAINGKVIDVATAYGTMQGMLSLSPEEFAQELKDNPATLESVQSFIDDGLLPPYHPFCHGTIIVRSAFNRPKKGAGRFFKGLFLPRRYTEKTKDSDGAKSAKEIKETAVEFMKAVKAIASRPVEIKIDQKQPVVHVDAHVHMTQARGSTFELTDPATGKVVRTLKAKDE